MGIVDEFIQDVKYALVFIISLIFITAIVIIPVLALVALVMIIAGVFTIAVGVLTIGGAIIICFVLITFPIWGLIWYLVENRGKKNGMP